jgi:hypothetical protein
VRAARCDVGHAVHVRCCLRHTHTHTHTHTIGCPTARPRRCCTWPSSARTSPSSAASQRAASPCRCRRPRRRASRRAAGGCARCTCAWARATSRLRGWRSCGASAASRGGVWVGVVGCTAWGWWWGARRGACLGCMGWCGALCVCGDSEGVPRLAQPSRCVFCRCAALYRDRRPQPVCECGALWQPAAPRAARPAGAARRPHQPRAAQRRCDHTRGSTAGRCSRAQPCRELPQPPRRRPRQLRQRRLRAQRGWRRGRQRQQRSRRGAAARAAHAVWAAAPAPAGVPPAHPAAAGAGGRPQQPAGACVCEEGGGGGGGERGAAHTRLPLAAAAAPAHARRCDGVAS